MPATLGSPLPENRADLAARIRDDLDRLRELRGAVCASTENAKDRIALRAWQADRLAQTYRDLSAVPRYQPATEFFLSDLYGPKDTSERDEEVARVVPMMTSMLPVGGVQSLAMAIELDALSEDLDAQMVRALRRGRRSGPLRITEETYAAAYRACDNRAEREAQIHLVDRIGHLLDRIAHKPLVTAAMEMMRGPAHLAGLGALHDFLERGLHAFRHLNEADEFLATVAARETAIMERLFAGAPKPFAPEP